MDDENSFSSEYDEEPVKNTKKKRTNVKIMDDENSFSSEYDEEPVKNTKKKRTNVKIMDDEYSLSSEYDEKPARNIKKNNKRKETLFSETDDENYDESYAENSEDEDIQDETSLSSEYESFSEEESSSGAIVLSQEDTLPEWTFSNTRVFHTYIPQIGENIVYIKKGHLEYKKACSYMHYMPPYEIQKKMPNVASAYIVDVQFYVSHLILTLQFCNFEGSVSYPLPESPPFLTTKYEFDESIKYCSTLKQGDIIKVVFQDGDEAKEFEAILKKIKPNFEKDPWGSIIIQLIDDSSICYLEPWEVIRPNRTDSQLQCKMNDLMNDLKTQLIKIMRKPENKNLVEIREPKTQKILVRNSHQPMDLKLINERLTNHWYTTPDSILNDINILESNSKLLNLPTNISNIHKQLNEQIIEQAQKMNIPIYKKTKKAISNTESDDPSTD